MLYIFSNSDDKSIHHIVCADSDIRAGIIISRIYEREHISGEPIRVQFYNETATTASIAGVAKRYEAIKATDKSNDTFEEEIRAKVAELNKSKSKINLSKTVKPNVTPVVPYDNPEEFIYKANINELVSRYYKHELNANRLAVIREVARDYHYDVDKFIKYVSDAHKVAHAAYMKHKVNNNKSDKSNNEISND